MIMTRELLLFRHGKSDWSTGVDDYHRPLKDRGKRGAQRIGVWLAQQKMIPDLIVTSPPYAANAIDYMRAHKFSLVWLGHSIDDLSALRARYIGGESTVGQDLLPLPLHSLEMVQRITHIDRKKGLALHRYYSEMTRVLTGAFRVLKPRGAAVFVVGSSTMCGIDTQTHICLGEIGHSIGFELDGIARRSLDRNRRMMPARARGARQSQIEERMHEEYVIGFVKPAS